MHERLACESGQYNPSCFDVMLRYLAPGLACAAAIVAGACGGGPGAGTKSPDTRVRELADTYLAAYFERFPEQITYFGVPGRPQSGLTDNSLAALRASEAREDGFLASLKQIDPSAIGAAPLRATYAIARQTLEAAVAKRVCRDQLWNVSEMT
ncbi:MAG: hypothetical protein JF601_10855, partial [Acidobacteria bacterium]|nr:hypothetical protein [Acidobacteriota bacterium]